MRNNPKEEVEGLVRFFRPGPSFTVTEELRALGGGARTRELSFTADGEGGKRSDTPS